jgi:response regulator RpfG family c-di-GMP phosphodiesterase
LARYDHPSELEALARSRSAPLERFLEAARDLLDVDVSFISAFRGGAQVYEAVSGDGSSFGIRPGGSLALDQAVCQRVIDGTAPPVMADTGAHAAVRDLDAVVARGIKCYVGVPLRFSDGRLYGMFCCLGHESRAALSERDTAFLNVLARMVVDQIEREKLAHENQRLQTAAVTAGALLLALEARDGYTGEHTHAVVELATRVARQLGLSDADVNTVEQVALLHDVGKLGIRDAILHKRGPLDAAEWALMRQHPAIGERLVSSLPSLSHLAPAIRAEHERWDGAGYPDGLARDAIPIASRIALVADAYHAMTSDRPYRRALPTSVAIDELERGSGKQFCPHTVEATLAVLATVESESSPAAFFEIAPSPPTSSAATNGNVSCNGERDGTAYSGGGNGSGRRVVG